MHRLTRLPILATFAVVWLACSIARADYVTNHAGGHGPLPAAGSMPRWGNVELCCTPAGGGERWLGDVAGSYWAYPTPGQVWIRRSPAPNTYAVAYEHATYPYGHTLVVASSWNAVPLTWTIGLVTIQYDVSCPILAMSVVHVCSGSWTPMDSGNVPTVIIGDGLTQPGLPYGNYLKDTSNTGYGSWCGANFSDYPGVTKPPGMPNHVVAIDHCP